MIICYDVLADYVVRDARGADMIIVAADTRLLGSEILRRQYLRFVGLRAAQMGRTVVFVDYAGRSLMWSRLGSPAPGRPLGSQISLFEASIPD